MLARYFSLIICAFFISSCGFQPIYGDNDVGKKLSRIKIGSISYTSKMPTREALELKSELERELNWSYTNSYKSYTLNISYSTYFEGAAIQHNSLAFRNNLKIILNYQLLDNESGKNIASEALIEVESFDTPPDSPFSNYISKEEIAVRMMQNLANQLKLRLVGVI